VFIGSLYDYQIDDCKALLAMKSGINASPCGLGKTVEMLAMCEYLYSTGNFDSSIIVCRHPHEWAGMIEKFTDSSFLVYTGTTKQREKLRVAYSSTNKYLVLSYGITLQDIDIRFLRNVRNKRTILIVDEAHKLKSVRSRKSKSLKGLGELAGRRYALTATPIWNKLDDLFGVMEWVDKDFFGPWYSFKEQYIIDNFFGKIIGYKNLDELNNRLPKRMVRRTAESAGVSLPETVFSLCPLVPQGQHKDLLKKITKYTLDKLCEMESDGEFSWQSPSRSKKALSSLTVLDQAGICPDLLDEFAPTDLEIASSCGVGAKVAECAATLDDIIGYGANAVVFCRYLGGIKSLDSYLRSGAKMYKSFILTGGTKNKEEVLNEFRISCRKGGAVLLSSDVGGESLNLPEVSYTLHLDVPWGAADLEQRNSRMRRVDSSHKTNIVVQFIIPGLDEYKYWLCRWKSDYAAFVMDGEEVSTSKPMLRDFITDKFVRL